MPRTERDDRVLSYTPLVERVVRRVEAGLPRSTDKDALMGAGMLGLLQALDKYDPDKGVAFEAYAQIRIRGAVQDELRSLDHLTRSQRRRAIDARNAEEALMKAASGPVAERDVAAAADLDLSDVRLGSLHAAPPKSYDPHVLDDRVTETPWQIQIGVEEQIAQQQLLLQLEDAMARLPTREREIISLYYGDDLTLQEVGDLLGVSQSRVSQILSRIRGKLRRRLMPEA